MDENLKPSLFKKYFFSVIYIGTITYLTHMICFDSGASGITLKKFFVLMICIPFLIPMFFYYSIFIIFIVSMPILTVFNSKKEKSENGFDPMEDFRQSMFFFYDSKLFCLYFNYGVFLIWTIYVSEKNYNGHYVFFYSFLLIPLMKIVEKLSSKMNILFKEMLK